MSKRKILVTSALPYANGSIHLGHLVEYIQTDIWVRFQKMQGPPHGNGDANEVYYICADDTHGTPVMLRAEKEGITPEALIARVHGEHLADFTGFHVRFDHYGSTHSDETREYAQTIYRQLHEADLIDVKDVEQYYDPIKEMFLPDRYIKGECPKCGAKDQYGDSCEVCGAAYAPTDLKNPYSAVSGTTPVRRASKHYFFKLSATRCVEFLRKWTTSGTLQAEAANKMQEWLGNEGENKLSDWDISRDAPYFGFSIPDTNDKKFFYVWLDAPVGYMGSFKKFCAEKNINFDDFWLKKGNDGIEPQTELCHFIGKDILYFHALFWPAMLENAGYRTPTKIFAHGFLTVNGEKMSKSRGTFITAKSYLDTGLNPEWLRYYYAAKLNGTMEDIDLNFDDFVARVNSDLVGKYINIASRSAGFISKKFGGRLCSVLTPEATDWLQRFKTGNGGKGALDKTKIEVGANAIAETFFEENEEIHIERHKLIVAYYEEREYAKALREIMLLADIANQYVDQHKPWELSRQEGMESKLHEVCTVSLNMFRLLTLYLKPVLPALAAKVEAFLNIPPLRWHDAQTLLLGHAINPYQHLITRVEQKQIDALIAANRESLSPK